MFSFRAHKSSAERHYRTLHCQEQSFECHICSDVLKNQAVFNAHMKQKHSMNMSTVRSSVPRPSVKATRVLRKNAAAANVKREPGSSKRRGAPPVATAPRNRIKLERKDLKKEAVAMVKKEEAEDQKPVVVVKEEKKDDEGKVIILTQHN